MKSADAVEHIWDVVVIGGGPAGMMAAGRAAERGRDVLLIEKNPTLGKKLLITGGGRCNVTNAEFDTRKLLAKFADSGKFLFSPFSEWNVERSIEFFTKRGMPIKIEAEKRVFPVSDSARSVWSILLAYLQAGNVRILSSAPVASLIAINGTIDRIRLKNGQEIRAKSFILATGGTSRPETGSTGDGFTFLKQLGHTVNLEGAALVPLALKDPWTKRLAGVARLSAKVTAFQNNVKQVSRVGKILFTHVGLSGPAVLNLSGDIGELLKYGEVTLEIDLLPTEGYEKVNAQLQALLQTNSNKKIKNGLGQLVPTALLEVILDLAKINPDTFCNSVKREERIRLMKTLKHFPAHVKNLLGLDKAIVTSGGLSLKEVDFKTMRSHLYQNLYVVGDVLDIDRPSGGYSLQLCWTTGFVAGENA